MSEETKKPEFDVEEIDDSQLEDVSGGALSGCSGCDGCSVCDGNNPQY